MVWGIGLRRLGCGCGRRLVTGSCVYLRDDPDGSSAVSAARFSIYLSIYLSSKSWGAATMGCFNKSTASASDRSTKFNLLSVRWEIAPDPIGEGGFGSVHLATHRKTGKVRTADSALALGARTASALAARLGRSLACARACTCACDYAPWPWRTTGPARRLVAQLRAFAAFLAVLYPSRCERSRRCASRRVRSGTTSATRSSS